MTTFYVNSSKLPNMVAFGLNAGLASAQRDLVLGLLQNHFDDALVEKQEADFAVYVQDTGSRLVTKVESLDPNAESAHPDLPPYLKAFFAGRAGTFGQAKQPYDHSPDELFRALFDLFDDLDHLDALMPTLMQMGRGYVTMLSHAAAIFTGEKPSFTVSFDTGWGDGNGLSVNAQLKQDHIQLELETTAASSDFTLFATFDKDGDEYSGEITQTNDGRAKKLTFTFSDTPVETPAAAEPTATETQAA